MNNVEAVTGSRPTHAQATERATGLLVRDVAFFYPPMPKRAGTDYNRARPHIGRRWAAGMYRSIPRVYPGRFMSGLHWQAWSERERQQAIELARSLQKKESRDELGIGTVRDAISDRLFPGTSTLHTRARYRYLHLSIGRSTAQAAPLAP